VNDRRYARFYYPEFIRDYPEVYTDDAAFATWMRLLATAEQMWPMTPELPRSVKPRPLARLTERGLVTTDGVTFHVKGLDAERTRRSNAGRIGAAVRWDSDGNADGNANAMPSTRTSTRRDKTSIPPPPAERGRRSEGTNPRAVGASPRQNGHAPRNEGTSPRQVRRAEKRDPTPIAVILARADSDRSDL
jgi:hypothetical protein